MKIHAYYRLRLGTAHSVLHIHCAAPPVTATPGRLQGVIQHT
ncbi:hypothetical protein PCH70_30680 [Pseudomonas cichorii JBC1]|nr:hypothetical protein PCH70_30680 [Pseudomonas cichorii JBC1]